MRPLSFLLEHLITRGTLRVIDCAGKCHVFSGQEGSCVTIRLHDRSLYWRLFFTPRLTVGEAYMDGTLTIEDASIYDFLVLCGRNIFRAKPHPFQTFYGDLNSVARWISQFNPVAKSQRRIAHHYDLSEKLYDLFLDPDKQYSCGYFATGTESLEQAQEYKKRHIAAKLLLKPGLKILDIGSGWGGLALDLAGISGTDITGITLSKEQLRVARKRARESGLSDRVHFDLRDYRHQTGCFDRIVSVGMFEHVGIAHYYAFFESVHRLLADDGVALLHSIGTMSGPNQTNPWLRKYIFPGGHFPALSEVVQAVEKAGFWITDIEILRLHYAETLRAWRQRFQAKRHEAEQLYDERFYRMWEFYLAISEMAFREKDLMVFQIQISKSRDAVPLTRDYIAQWESGYREGAALTE